jgi:hypothetical protein
MNQKARWRSIPGAAFHDLLCDPASCRMRRHFNEEDLSVCEPDDEEDVKRLEQDRRDAENCHRLGWQTKEGPACNDHGRHADQYDWKSDMAAIGARSTMAC